MFCSAFIRRKWHRVAFALFSFSALLLAGQLALRSATAKEPAVVADQAVVGWDGIYKAGCWTTVRVTLQAASGKENSQPIAGRVRCVSVDGDNVPVTYDDPHGDFQLQPGSSQELELSLQAGGLGAKVALEFELADGQIWQQPITLPSPIAATREIVVTLGPELDAEHLPRYIRRRDAFSFVPVNVTEVEQVPHDMRPYANVDIVLLSLSRQSLFDQMSAEQRTALLEWVQQGGRLVLTSATRGPQQFGPAGPLAELAPGKIRGVVRMKRTIGIETAGGAAVDIDTVAAGRAPFVLDYESVDGRVDLWEVEGGDNDQPLVVRRNYGFGQVQLIGLDLDQPPWADWPGRPRFIADLLQDERSNMSAEQESGIRGEVTHLGYEDLTGQLRTALEQFQQVTFLNFTLVAVIASLYLLLIGPVDYYVIRRFGLPRHITWGSLLFLVVCASGLAWYIADRSHGRQVWVNQAEVVDVDLSNGDVRGVSWLHIYSPASAQYDVQWKPSQQNKTNVQEAWLSWQGLAGQGLGGLSVRASNFQPSVGYSVDLQPKAAKIEELPIPFAGSKGLRAQWRGKTGLRAAETLASDPYGQLRGELKNPLPFELTECRLIFRDHLYKLNKPLPAGGSLNLNTMTPLNLEARLTQRVVLDQQDRATAWDASRTDVPRIMEMLMFHEAANGSGYTQLVHRYQSQLDFSSQIELNQAVLVGQCATSQGDLQINEQSASQTNRYDQRWTWFRVLIPVQTPTQDEGK